MEALLWDDLYSTDKILFPRLIGKELLSCNKSKEQDETLEM